MSGWDWDENVLGENDVNTESSTWNKIDSERVVNHKYELIISDVSALYYGRMHGLGYQIS